MGLGGVMTPLSMNSVAELNALEAEAKHSMKSKENKELEEQAESLAKDDMSIVQELDKALLDAVRLRYLAARREASVERMVAHFNKSTTEMEQNAAVKSWLEDMMTEKAEADKAMQAAEKRTQDTINMHNKRLEDLQLKIDKTIEEAKKYMAQGAKGKKRALQCMKRKQIYQNQMDQLNNMKMNLENQMYQMQSLNMNQEQIRAQQAANRAMQAQMQSMGGIDGIQEVQDNAQDLLQDVAEINDVMGASIDTPGLDMDEDDLLAELEGLEGDTLTQQMGSVDLGKEMPSAPVQFPDAGTKEVKMTAEEKELAELQASRGM